MKKLCCVFLVMLLSVVLFGCNDSKKIEVSIIQYVTAEALDQARIGIVTELEENGFVDGENINITIYNPQQNVDLLSQMVEQAVRKSDIIFAIATPVAVAVCNESKKQASNVPIIFTAVTDPVDSGIVSNNELPGGNVTGTNDMNPIALQVSLLKKLNPQATKLGVLYTSSERNSEVQVAIVKEEAEKLGIEVIVQTINSVNDIQNMTMSLINSQVDAIYLPTDNNIASSVTSVTNETNQQGIPTICGEGGMLSGKGTITFGIDYLELGKITGQMGADVLNGTDPGTMAVRGLEQFSLMINKKVADEFNISISEELLEEADVVLTE